MQGNFVLKFQYFFHVHKDHKSDAGYIDQH
ncbi:hypothetical protein BXY58_2897 [Epilithonimonas arachidiradicis]|uniref:Uncharacterized protein n=1 Tax=Epilithonimonas arachidiradicis TaxID=1617282 RepID=A0A420CPS3_9FLAO|nr:hypothetical protein BXY58_2897 [Epilithonimonas arachidiradicis]